MSYTLVRFILKYIGYFEYGATLIPPVLGQLVEFWVCGGSLSAHAVVLCITIASMIMLLQALDL